MDEKVCILFAGPIGCSKSPVAMFLSWNLGYPIFSTDTIRTEIHENNLDSESVEEEKKIVERERLAIALKMNNKIIIDSSIDRKYIEILDHLNKLGFKHFIISFDLSKEFLKRLYIAKGYTESLKIIDRTIADHKNFINNLKQEVNVHITDENFSKRNEVVLDAFKKLYVSQTL